MVLVIKFVWITRVNICVNKGDKSLMIAVQKPGGRPLKSKHNARISCSHRVRRGHGTECCAKGKTPYDVIDCHWGSRRKRAVGDDSKAFCLDYAIELWFCS